MGIEQGKDTIEFVPIVADERTFHGLEEIMTEIKSHEIPFYAELKLTNRFVSSMTVLEEGQISFHAESHT